MVGPQSNDSNLRQIADILRQTFDQERELLALATGQSRGIDPSRYIFQPFEDDSGSSDMAVDASGGIGYRYTCPANTVVAIRRITFWGVDAAKPLPNGFFTITALAVDEGTTIRLHDADDAIIKDFVPGSEIRHHEHLGLLAGVDVQTASDGGAQGGWAGRWTLAEAAAPTRLTAGQYFEVVNRSAALAGFDMYEWMAQGHRVTP